MALTPKQRKAALEKGFSVNLTPPDEAKYLSPNPKAATQLFAKTAEGSKDASSLPADRQYYRQTVCQDYRQTGSEEDDEKPISLPADRLPVDKNNLYLSSDSRIPLAPVQWAIWEALCEADSAGRLVSYRKLAQAVNASIRGVRDALTVIEKEGGIRCKTTIRTPDEQGMRIEIDKEKQFRQASLKETKGLLKREGNYRQTVDRQSVVLPADGLRLSVSITKYIRQTDIGDLLQLFPPTWNVRERTLTEIARTLPLMTLIEFRRSLALLVEQAAKSKTQIQNHNAWLKAAFAKNEGPFVTERMIEAQLDHFASRPKDKVLQPAPRKDMQDANLQADLSALRMYVTAKAEERAIIDAKAKEKAVTALRITPAGKHNEILEQALIESSREYFLANPLKETEKNDVTTD